MTAPAGTTRLLLEGSADALALAVDRLHVHAEVQGVEERDGACEVWLAGDWRLAVGELSGLRARELPITADLFAHTGREHDAPILVAPDLCVRPPWVPQPAGFSGIELVVPRGQAFGSGEHASTRAALLALHRHWPAWAVAGMVDVGTGSGILGLYGAVRGATRIVACDIDLAAARAAAALVPAVYAVCGSPRVLAATADVVVANMTASELGAELGAIVRLWRRRGLFVLSGLQGSEQVAACRRACGALLPAPARDEVAVGAFAALVFAAGAR